MCDVRLGLYLHERKRVRFAEFVSLCRSRGVQVVETDLLNDDDLADVNVVLHKITDDLSEEHPSEVSKKRIDCLNRFTKEHPDVAIIDPIESLPKIMDRAVMYRLLSSLSLPDEFASKVKCPEFITAQSYEEATRLVKEASIAPPLMCKTVRACGTAESHIMSVVFSAEAIKSCSVDLPICVSRYVNHGGTLWKVYVLDTFIHAVSRESTANVSPDQTAVVTFDSQKLSKACIPPPDGKPAPPKNGHSEIPENRDHFPELLEAIAAGIRKALGVTLFGFDLIREGDDIFHVIDVNYFPTYDGIANMNEMLLEYIRSRAMK